jgi:hypothetical protein
MPNNDYKFIAYILRDSIHQIVIYMPSYRYTATQDESVGEPLQNYMSISNNLEHFIDTTIRNVRTHDSDTYILNGADCPGCNVVGSV